MSSTNTMQIRLKFKPGADDCRRCGAELLAMPISESQPAPGSRYFRICRDVSACHDRMMRPRLRVLPGGASY